MNEANSRSPGSSDRSDAPAGSKKTVHFAKVFLFSFLVGCAVTAAPFWVYKARLNFVAVLLVGLLLGGLTTLSIWHKTRGGTRPLPDDDSWDSGSDPSDRSGSGSSGGHSSSGEPGSSGGFGGGHGGGGSFPGGGAGRR